MTAAISNFIQIEAKEKIAILGDMFELGKESLIEHAKVIQLLENTQIETYFVGKDFFKSKIEKENLHFFDTYENFEKNFKTVNPKNQKILIKGSRGMALERTLEII